VTDKKYILGLILLSQLLTNCSYRSDKFGQNGSDLKSMSYADSLWIEYKNALQNQRIDYLIDNSLDSIQCVDCVPDSGKLSDIFDSKYIFENHLKELMHLDSLTNDYSAFQNDSMIFINYTIKDNKSEEGGYNLIYIFKKSNQRYLFSGMLTTP
jgi:hypothetical protein